MLLALEDNRPIFYLKYPDHLNELMTIVYCVKIIKEKEIINKY